jgi:hypothetical protein
VIARDSTTGEAIAFFEKVVRSAYINGEVRALPYLGALRIAPSHRHRPDLVRGIGCACRAVCHQAGETPFALTAITADNNVARRLATAGHPGLPKFHWLCDFSTFALRPRRLTATHGIVSATDDDFAALAAFLERINRPLPFAPVWSEASLRGSPGEFLLLKRAGVIHGCLSLWDRRASRQTIIRRYPRHLSRWRRLLNVVSPLTGLVRLPPPGTPLNQVLLTHLSAEADDPEDILALVGAGLDRAWQRGFEIMILSCSAGRPWRSRLQRHFRGMEYRSGIYLAHWPEDAAEVASVGHGMAYPEFALF